jgi:myo-inositol-1(or 4)-monophosphatase
MNLLDTAIEAARAAGQEIIRRWPQERDVRSKGFRDIVTDADLAAQEALIAIIRARFPQHGILSEEGLAPTNNADTVWVLDPLDGTTNYARHLPSFSVSVAVARSDALIAGVVYDPLRDYIFCAERGAGATWNGQRLHVSQVDDLGQAVAGVDFAREPAIRSSQMATMVVCSERIRTFRSFGSAALGLCFVAAGWTDAYFHFDLAPWDMAAGALIVMEAGGVITSTDGKPWSYTQPRCLATNGKLHAAFLGLMRT